MLHPQKEGRPQLAKNAKKLEQRDVQMPQNWTQTGEPRRAEEAIDPDKTGTVPRNLPDCEQLQEVRETEREFECEVS